MIVTIIIDAICCLVLINEKIRTVNIVKTVLVPSGYAGCTAVDGECT